MSARPRGLAVVAVCCLLALFAGRRPTAQVSRTQVRVTVIGNIVDVALAPLPGVNIRLEQSGRAAASAVTDQYGKFTLKDIPSGNYQLQAECAGFLALTRALTIPHDVTRLRLPIVLQRENERQPLPTPTVGRVGLSLFRSSPDVANAIGDREFARWNSGRYLSINGGPSQQTNTTRAGNPPGREGDSGARQITPNVDPTGGASAPIRPAAPRSRTTAQVSSTRVRVTVIGNIVDLSLAPVPGVNVRLEQSGVTSASAMTDRYGNFTLKDIPSGNYRLQAECAGFITVARDFTIPANVTNLRLPIVLRRVSEPQPPSTPIGALTSPSPASLRGLQILPGVADANPSRDFAQWNSGRYLSINGGTSLNKNTTIDGIPSGEGRGNGVTHITPNVDSIGQVPGTERYLQFESNRFQQTLANPLSTFGADVDTASYTNVRRFLNNGQLPPTDAVRVEEFVNYFRFPYPQPQGGQTIGVTTEVGDCPWAPSHKLMLIGARAKAAQPREIEGRNIVLLIDVSGSMSPPERLPLIKTALGMFVDTLRPDDRIAIVTYAGSSGLALPSTLARQRDVIQRAIASLGAGGSTNGGGGLTLAYRIALESFIPGGVNRVILATDGDFNVGIVNQRDLLHLIERQRESGVFLSVLGVGSGNLQDATMQMLADHGNGQYAYLDSLDEARRVLIREGESTLETVAKDVKFQVEFNPAVVRAWKQVGYEKRALAAQDFNDDRKDAGEMGAGHTVTVLYELIPAGVKDDEDTVPAASIDPLKYQTPNRPPAEMPAQARSGEWATVKARYKLPDEETSKLMTHVVRPGTQSGILPFAAAVAEFGLLLRNQTADLHRWDALAARVNNLDAPRNLSKEKADFAELVASARAIAKLRR